jgi:hypothetical protein
MNRHIVIHFPGNPQRSLGAYERWNEASGPGLPEVVRGEQIIPGAHDDVDFIFFRTQEEAEMGARALAAQHPADTFMIAAVNSIVRTAPGELFVSNVTDRSILPR